MAFLLLTGWGRGSFTQLHSASGWSGIFKKALLLFVGGPLSYFPVAPLYSHGELGLPSSMAFSRVSDFLQSDAKGSIPKRKSEAANRPKA